MFLQTFFKGIIIGIAFIIPGVSGGVLATIFGIYEKIIHSFNNLFKNFKISFIFLFPLFLGISVGALMFSNIIIYLFNYQKNFISYVFIGMILGCIPYLFSEIKHKTSQNISFFHVFLSLTIGILLYCFKPHVPSKEDFTISYMIIAGIIYAIGKIIPGISSSAFLIFLGIYEYLLHIIASPLHISLATIINLIPFIVSFIISIFLLLKFTSYLLTNHFQKTYSCIIGFVISSILFIYPNFISIESLIILISSFILSYLFSTKSQIKEK